MGLASKLQAAQQQPVFQQQYQGQSNAVSYQQNYPAQNASQPYWAGAAPQRPQLPGVDVQSIHARLASIVQQNNLQTLYPGQRLQVLASDVAQRDLQGLASRWRLPPNHSNGRSARNGTPLAKLVLDLVALALYDIVVLADDSGSMRFAEEGTRIEDLKAMLGRIADAAALFDSDGISVRFLNSNLAGNNLRTPDEIQACVAQVNFDGLTPMGTMLERKMIQPFVTGPATHNTLRKPVLIIIITDGEPRGEPGSAVYSAIKSAKKTLSHLACGSNAVAFQFAQVGRDEEATRFLGKLDSDSKIGGMIDATSYYELEQEEYKKKGIDLTPDQYMVKLLVGAIDSSYDEQDEVKKKKRGFWSSLIQ